MVSFLSLLLLLGTGGSLAQPGTAGTTVDPTFDNATTLSATSRKRAVLQTEFGDIHIAFYPKAAPRTTELVTRLLELGMYNSNHFFRVDKGFVAQVASVDSGRLFQRMNDEQAEWAGKTVPLEVHPELKHDRAGLLSLARHDDPNSGGSSFSIMLGPAPHLDMNYAIFGEVVSGLDPLRAMEEVETTTSGIFVMPRERITIHSTYIYDAAGDPDTTVSGGGTTTGAKANAKAGAEAGAEADAEANAERSSCASHVASALRAVRGELTS
jgi:cyclophilin family peptidyl-prolyl cis-trans isomerase